MVKPTLLLASSTLLAVTTISARPWVPVSLASAGPAAVDAAASANAVAGIVIQARHNMLLAWYGFAVKRDDICYRPGPEIGLFPHRRTVAYLRPVLTPALLRASTLGYPVPSSAC